MSRDQVRRASLVQKSLLAASVVVSPYFQYTEPVHEPLLGPRPAVLTLVERSFAGGSQSNRVLLWLAQEGDPSPVDGGSHNAPNISSLSTHYCMHRDLFLSYDAECGARRVFCAGASARGVCACAWARGRLGPRGGPFRCSAVPLYCCTAVPAGPAGGGFVCPRL